MNLFPSSSQSYFVALKAPALVGESIFTIGPLFISRRDVRGVNYTLLNQSSPHFATQDMANGLRLDVLLEKTFVHDEAKGVHCFSSDFFKLIEHRN